MTHWNERVQERIGTVDPDVLHQGLVWAIKNDRTDLVQAIGRVSRDGKRVFKFRVPDGRVFFALVNTSNMNPMTVMPPDFTVKRQGKPPINLQQYA